MCQLERLGMVGRPLSPFVVYKLIKLVSRSGGRLPAYVIYQGSKNGKVKKTDCSKLNKIDPDAAFFSTQPNNWMDVGMMLEWIEIIVKPYLQERQFKKSVMLLDSMQAHKMTVIRQSLAAMNCHLMILPSGQTSAIQVLDVGVNGPFKKNVTKFLVCYRNKEADKRAEALDSIRQLQDLYINLSKLSLESGSQQNVSIKLNLSEYDKLVYEMDVPIGRDEIALAIMHSWKLIKQESIINTWQKILSC